MHYSETSAAPTRFSPVPVLFTMTIFLSASLLFFVQPLFAKIVLPQIGGAPAVWTTAMLFFQSVLIGGYLYAHLLSRYVPRRLQVVCHLAIWGAALLFLPLSIPAGWTYDPGKSATVQTLALFATGVGVPFAVLSANAPLIQSWYGATGGPSADDPYFLYGASNLGSLIALLAFPLMAEPLFAADSIGRGWMYGFVGLGVFLFLSGICARGADPASAAPRQAASSLTARQVSGWLVLAFVPSSMMLAVTSKISTDIGAMPLVWVVPLALYLLSFVLTFTRRPIVGQRALRMGCIGALTVLGLVFSNVTGSHLSWPGVIGLIVSFLIVAMFCHARLYHRRPDAGNLTIFYLTMSVGGSLGGLFNSVIAPVGFDTLAEGGVTTLIAAMLVLSGRMKLTLPMAAIGIGAGLCAALPMLLATRGFAIQDDTLLALLLVGLIALVAVSLRRNLLTAAIAAATLTLVGSGFIPDTTLFRDRSFFGTHLVSETDGLRLYANGTTVHGAQRLADADRPEPLYYYHRNGPMAQILTSAPGRAARSVGIVGLGVGSLACYRQPGQDWHFYEIDQVVDRVARDPSLFTFLSRCAPDAPTHMGDARLVLADQGGMGFDILVIDAYSSDAVPVHLTTYEAMQLYLERLNPGGILVFHISNRYYAIERPLGRSVAALGLTARIQNYPGNIALDPADTASRVVMIARSEGDFSALNDDPRWSVLRADGGRIWTDTYANLLAILE